ncbi:NUDIX hydrolase [Rhodoblastus sp.]|uniref:NUDIX hydrolase n=1 Tax=Rhodoblastus sp. TaxID=1962975 RepID=UPI0035B3C321
MSGKPRKIQKKAKKAAKVAPEALEPMVRQQFAALPWRMMNGALEIMLVSSRDTRRWIIPKGWPMAGRSPAAAAAIEAMEEAGLLGVMSEEPVGYFHYAKRLSSRTDHCRVEVFSLRVVRQRDHWPEKHERATQWFSIEEAIASVSDPELADLIAAFARDADGLSAP